MAGLSDFDPNTTVQAVAAAIGVNPVTPPMQPPFEGGETLFRAAMARKAVDMSQANAAPKMPTISSTLARVEEHTGRVVGLLEHIAEMGGFLHGGRIETIEKAVAGAADGVLARIEAALDYQAKALERAEAEIQSLRRGLGISA